MTLPREVDAVVIGAGPNGLVAANRLADAGWETLLLEAQPEVGGAVRSDRELHPDFVSDTFSAFYPVGYASRVIKGLHLEEHGLRWQHAPAVLGHPLPDGSWVMLHRDVDVTASLLDAEHPGDGAAWRALVDQWQRIGPSLVDALVTPFPPLGPGLRTMIKLPRVGGLSFVRQMLSPAAVAFGQEFGGKAFRLLLAGVHADHLYCRFFLFNGLPPRVRVKMAGFRRDPATFKVDYALSAQTPWRTPPPYAPGTVHISDSFEELIMTVAQLGVGSIPDRPFLLMGQMTTADPTRSPDGTESMWAYTHVPQRVRNDAGGNLTGSWDAEEAERFADRMQDRIEQYAPGFSERIIARRILTPLDLERRDARLVGGSLNGGTAALDQQLIFRPFAGLGRADTPIRGLYLASASAHPGGAVHGACGMNAARAALARARLTPRISARGRAQVSAEPDRSEILG